MKLKEALPKPGQSPLGGVSPDDTEVLVGGYGRIKYSQLLTHIKSSLEKLNMELERLEKPELYRSKFSPNLLKNQSADLKALLDALAKHLESQNKSEELDPKKAKTILRHGEVSGHPLSKKQKGLFGAIAGGSPLKKY